MAILDNLNAAIWRKRCQGEAEISIVLTKDVEQMILWEPHLIYPDTDYIPPERLPKGGSIWGCKYYRYDDTLPPIRSDSILFYRGEGRYE